MLDDHLKSIERNQNRIKDSVEDLWGNLLQAEEKRALEMSGRNRAAHISRLEQVKSETHEKITDQYMGAMKKIENMLDLIISII